MGSVLCGTDENTNMQKYSAKIQEYWFGWGLFCFGSDGNSGVDSGVDCSAQKFLR